MLKIIKSPLALATIGILSLAAGGAHAARVSLNVQSLTVVNADNMTFSSALTQANLEAGGQATSLVSFNAYTTALSNPNINFTLASPQTDSTGPYLAVAGSSSSAKIHYKIEITPCGSGASATEYKPTTTSGTTVQVDSVAQSICTANPGKIRVVLLPTPAGQAISAGEYEGTLNLTVSG